MVDDHKTATLRAGRNFGRVVFIFLLVLLSFGVPWDRLASPRAQVEGVGTGNCHTLDPSTGNYYMAPCDFGTGDGGSVVPEYEPVDGGGGSGGGGGCATTSDGDQASSSIPTPPVNVVEQGDYWFPAPGYQWENPDDPAANGYRVIPANLVLTDDGQYMAAPGYCFANWNDFTDLSVVPVGASPFGYANVVFDNDCYFVPAPGYNWENPNDPPGSSYRVIPQNLVRSEGGGYNPAPGYCWANLDDRRDVSVVPSGGSPLGMQNFIYTEDCSLIPAPGYDWADASHTTVVPKVPGAAVPYLDHVVYAADGGYLPASGYVWVNAADPADLRVVKAWSELASYDDFAAYDNSAFKTRLSIVEVPSPTGYRDPQQRRMQVAMLSDDQIEREIDRIRAMLEFMQEDFEQDTAALYEWSDQAENAQKEAIKAALDLGTGGTIKLMEQKGVSGAALADLAYFSKKMADHAAKIAVLERDNPELLYVELAAARDSLIQLYGKLYPFDERLVSQASAVGNLYAEFASFGLDYSYQLCRWALAYEQINIINENLGRDNGKLEAQKAIQRLYEDLIQERNRRRS